MNERYNRQVVLKHFGTAAQQKLLDAKVLVIGAGGLGCPALQYLASAGVGTLGIADDDIISVSNLPRQILYTTADIGQPKTTVAAMRLRAMNPDSCIVEHRVRITNSNALELLGQYDYILDGSDNFTARYLINDACVLLGKPLVFGAVYQYEGQVAVFNNPAGAGIHYRHLFPQPPDPDEAPDCSAAGVLATVPGVIGLLQATEIIKLITGIGKPLHSTLLTWNALTAAQTLIDLSAAASVPVTMPTTAAAYRAMSYEAFCNSSKSGAELIDAVQFYELSANSRIALVDIREPEEQPVAAFRHLHIPLSSFAKNLEQIAGYEGVVLFCQRGARSLQAAALLAAYAQRPARIYSLQGGIDSLNSSASIDRQESTTNEI